MWIWILKYSMVDLSCVLPSCSKVVLAAISYLCYFGNSFLQLLVETVSGLSTLKWKVCNWTVGTPEGQCEGFHEELPGSGVTWLWERYHLILHASREVLLVSIIGHTTEWPINISIVTKAVERPCLDPISSSCQLWLWGAGKIAELLVFECPELVQPRKGEGGVIGV